jgi:hypothetical protein
VRDKTAAQRGIADEKSAGSVHDDGHNPPEKEIDARATETKEGKICEHETGWRYSLNGM